MYSETEENYLKAMYKIAQYQNDSVVNTKAISEEMGIRAASVTDMLQKLSEKSLVLYEKYYGAQLTSEGQKMAILLVRKHRLWEVFLHDKLGFSWDEVHDVAEQLEHIKSDLLVDKLDRYLGFPKFDPHGDPIPNAQGSFTFRSQSSLSKILQSNLLIQIVGVSRHDSNFLKHLNSLKIKLGDQFKIVKYIDFDGSYHLLNASGQTQVISQKVAEALLVKSKTS